MRRSVTPTNVASTIKSTQQYLLAVIRCWTREISCGTHFSPFLRSPAPFFRIRQCLEQITKTAPDTAYPAVDQVLARTRASCWDSQVLIFSNQMSDQRRNKYQNYWPLVHRHNSQYGSGTRTLGRKPPIRASIPRLWGVALCPWVWSFRQQR